jgi:hypothetical protein
LPKSVFDQRASLALLFAPAPGRAQRRHFRFRDAPLDNRRYRRTPFR